MFRTKARHFKRIGDTTACLFGQLLDFGIGVVMCDHYRIPLLQQALYFFTVELFFVPV
ncbi:hypothetical protein D3C72_1349790 [compost metagenome]